MQTKKGDFVEIKFVGRLDDGTIFDLNDKETAKKENVRGHFHDKTVVCLGERDVVEGLDESLMDNEIGKKFTITVSPEKGFGKKDAQMFHMIPHKKFVEHKINPVPGLQVDIDNMIGVVKSISGGRVLIDFNHPLAGRTLQYEVTITKKVDDVAEKVSGFLETTLHMHKVHVEAKEGTVTIKAELPNEAQSFLEEKIKRRVPEVKAVQFQK